MIMKVRMINNIYFFQCEDVLFLSVLFLSVIVDQIQLNFNIIWVGLS